MKKLLMIQWLWLAGFAFVGCGDLEPKAKNLSNSQQGQSEQSVEDSDSNAEQPAPVIAGPEIQASSLVFTDTLFSDYKWYSYNMLNHRVYPLFDVYALRSGSGAYYKVQIIDYYSKVSTQESGYYELRVQNPDGSVAKVEVDAVGCGMPVGGVAPVCDAQNTYAFLNLDTKEVEYMTPEEAVLVADWDLGFKRTEVLLNSPSVGVGSTQGALLYRNEGFFGAFGFAKYDLLMDAYVNGGEEQAFTDAGRLVP